MLGSVLSGQRCETRWSAATISETTHGEVQTGQRMGNVVYIDFQVSSADHRIRDDKSEWQWGRSPGQMFAIWAVGGLLSLMQPPPVYGLGETYLQIIDDTEKHSVYF